MSPPSPPAPTWIRAVLYLALAALIALHTDLWLWEVATPWFGLPAGLAYHLLYCLAASVLLALLVRFAWPEHLAAEAVDDDPV